MVKGLFLLMITLYLLCTFMNLGSVGPPNSWVLDQQLFVPPGAVLPTVGISQNLVNVNTYKPTISPRKSKDMAIVSKRLPIKYIANCC